ncbi:unnamed protein product [Urochloa humidicola]
MAPAAASVIFFGLLLLPHLCTSYQASYNPGSRRFIILSSDDESEASTSMPACSTIPSGPGNGNRLPLIHRDSPCSPLASAGKQSRGPPTSSSATLRDSGLYLGRHNPVELPQHLRRHQALPSPITGTDNGAVGGGLDYSVTVGLGTPAQQLPMDFDTLRLSLGMSTLRCKPCRAGVAPCDPAFDPGMSSSFASVVCGLECPSVCHGSVCSVNITSISNHSVAANCTFVKDTLTLLPSVTVENFVLACIDVDNFQSTGSSGLLDLSQSNFSLVSRLTSSRSAADNTTASFSYCLPASPASTHGFLSIGGALPDLSGTDAGFTPLMASKPIPMMSDYLVKLVSIKVGGTELPLPGGIPWNLATLEVGASFTFFPPVIYTVLRDEFRKQMTKYTMAPPYRTLDTCYNFTGLPRFEIPGIILEFEVGAALQPDVDQMMYFVDGDHSLNYVCLAFAQLPELFPYSSVIGNRAQQTVEVVYDVPGGKVGFIKGSC